MKTNTAIKNSNLRYTFGAILATFAVLYTYAMDRALAGIKAITAIGNNLEDIGDDKATVLGELTEYVAKNVETIGDDVAIGLLGDIAEYAHDPVALVTSTGFTTFLATYPDNRWVTTISTWSGVPEVAANKAATVAHT